MKALRITKGDTTRIIALEHPGVLNVIINCIDIPDRQKDHVELLLAGLDCQSNTHVRWNPMDLQVGDQVVVEVIEDCDGDKPDETELRDPELQEEHRRQYLRDEAAKLGWVIQEDK